MQSYDRPFQLNLACTNDKQDLFAELATTFNESGYRLENGQFIRLRPHFYNVEDVIRGAVGGEFPLISLGSKIDIYELESRWKEHYPDLGPAVSKSFSFAASPVIFAMQPKIALQLGYPERHIGWRTLQMLVSELHDVKVTHAHGRTGDGALIATAEFIVGMERNRRPREVYDEQVISFVRTLEAAAAEYGPSDQDVITRSISGDRWLTSVMIAQERNILLALADRPEIQAILIYPEDGTVWADHPVALTSTWNEPDFHDAYAILRRHLVSEETQRKVIRHGYHFAQSEALGSTQEVNEFYESQAPASPNLQYLSYGAPPMVLPGIQVVRTIKKKWSGVKKPADVCLVIDISGSMSDLNKLEKVQAGIKEFLDMFGDSPDSMISLITFANTVRVDVDLVPLASSRRNVEAAVAHLNADGGTALFDAVVASVKKLELEGDADHIQAIMVLTDGQENSSTEDLSSVQDELKVHSQIFFCGIAYGKDADRQTLENIAAVTNGIVSDSSPSGILALFQELATRV